MSFIKSFHNVNNINIPQSFNIGSKLTVNKHIEEKLCTSIKPKTLALTTFVAEPTYLNNVLIHVEYKYSVQASQSQLANPVEIKPEVQTLIIFSVLFIILTICLLPLYGTSSPGAIDLICDDALATLLHVSNDPKLSVEVNRIIALGLF